MKYFFLFLLSINSVGFAQLERNSILVSSHHNLMLANGFKLGVEHQLYNHTINKKKNNKTKTKQYFVQPSLSFNNQKYSHYSISPCVDFGYRKIRTRGLKFEFLWGMGLQQNINQAKTYIVEDGEIKRRNLAGRTYFVQSFSLGIGQDFTTRCLPLAWHLRLNNNFIGPYNALIMPIISIEAGVTILMFHRKVLFHED